jgi:multidrug efflux pump subunit AcrA (membrane-fusion protein)
MKRRTKIIIGILIAVTAAGTTILVSCAKKTTQEHETEKAGEISHYTCPMHPQIHEDHPGECPICHMRLVPVYKEKAPEEKPAGAPSVSISTERQQLIGVKTGPVEKKAVAKEIRTFGRVAFDPELAIAQREFVEIVKNVPSLKEAATSRLKLLGMSDQEIRDLETKARKGVRPSTPTDLYLPEPGESVWVYASLYEYELPLVEIGNRATISSPSFPESLEGTIRAIDPVLDPMTRTARARIEVPGAGGQVKPESYFNVSIKIDLGEQLTVPKSAVIDTGTRQMVFVVHDGRHFQAREVKIGAEAGDDRVVREGLTEGETVATSAAFLIDSESQLKAAVTGMGEHKH